MTPREVFYTAALFLNFQDSNKMIDCILSVVLVSQFMLSIPRSDRLTVSPLITFLGLSQAWPYSFCKNNYWTNWCFMGILQINNHDDQHMFSLIRSFTSFQLPRCVANILAPNHHGRIVGPLIIHCSKYNLIRGIVEGYTVALRLCLFPHLYVYI